MKRTSGLIYEETRGVMKVFLENVIRDAVTYTSKIPTASCIPKDIKSIRHGYGKPVGCPWA